MPLYIRKLPHFLGPQDGRRTPGRTEARSPHGQAGDGPTGDHESREGMTTHLVEPVKLRRIFLAVSRR